MDLETVDSVLEFIENWPVTTLDLTGGAPEMNPHFKYLVEKATASGIKIIDRCNLTILGEPGFEDLPDFLADQGVTITASLPCYMEQNVEKQRGKNVYWESVAALKTLNKLGYGTDSRLELNLVYNPDGLNLPPNQQSLEQDYKHNLQTEHGITFNNLYTITNMPISRFGAMLLAKGLYQEYMEILKGSYSEANLATVMCKSLLSVDYRGFVYDCDFNQMLKMPLVWKGMPKTRLRDLVGQDLQDNPIMVGEHCFGCTAGQGSSCGGSLSE